MNFFVRLILIMLGILIVLGIVYVFFILKLNNLNKKIYKYKEEIIKKEKNILVIYQPSRHKTTNKIVEIIKNNLLEKKYGIKAVTISKNQEQYNKYAYVIFVLPVYFGKIHSYVKEIIKEINKTPVLIIYNGLNKESTHENDELKQFVKKKYSWIKVYTSNIEDVDKFINKEVK